MTNFNNPKPYISEKKVLPTKQHINKSEALKEAVKIIRENKRIVDAARKPSDENSHR